MRTIHKQRLLKLAKHLRGRKLGHDIFDFGILHSFNDCHSVGCAVGEMPYVFPKVFKVTGQEIHYRNSRHQMCDIGAAQDFFGLTLRGANHLFLPTHQLPHVFGGKALFRDATPKQVAANIEAFVKRKDKK